jgi:hypothetical protein
MACGKELWKVSVLQVVDREHRRQRRMLVVRHVRKMDDVGLQVLEEAV